MLQQIMSDDGFASADLTCITLQVKGQAINNLNFSELFCRHLWKGQVVEY